MSGIRSSVQCHCGQRITVRDVLQTGLYLRLFGPSYVCVKYRCSHCKKLGEQFVKQEEWDRGILRGAAEELTVSDKERFGSLGPIDINEVIDFHFQLERDKNLKDLGSAGGSSKKVKQRSSTEH